MKKLILIAALAMAIVPAAALAEGEPSAADVQSAQKSCADQRAKMGDAAFKALYGTNANKSNAFGKCVSKLARASQQNTATASAQCRTEQADAGFAAAHDGKSFDQYYGSGKSGKNAFGKCVSTKAQAKTSAQNAATVNAARACKAEQKAGPAAFKAKYGGKTNAFGKCVSAKAKAQQPAGS